MKQFITLIMIAVLSITLVACGINETKENNSENVVNEANEGNNSAENAPEVEVPEVEVPEEEPEVEITLTLEEIIDRMYLDSALEMPTTMKTPLAAENMEYMLGVSNFEYLEGFASEPMMSSQAHSVVLFKVDENADIETIKTDIKGNVDGRKWICVGVEEEDILVENVGNYVILIMDDEAQILMDAFLAIMQ